MCSSISAGVTGVIQSNTDVCETTEAGGNCAGR